MGAQVLPPAPARRKGRRAPPMLLHLWLCSCTCFMSDNVSTAAATAEVAVAVAERVRRPERSADVQQPPAVESANRKPSQRWRTYGHVDSPAGGKNVARMKQKFGPFEAATKEDAERKRDEAIDAWLHEPERKKKKVVDTSSSAPIEQGEVEPRAKRAASPLESGFFKQANISGSARLCTRASVRLLVGRVRVYGPTYSTSIASKQECHCHRPGVSLALGGARIAVVLPFTGI